MSKKKNAMTFAKKETSSKEDASSKLSWSIFIIDDDKSVHTITTIALKGFTFLGKGLEFKHAYSAKEARELFEKIDMPALILLDVVMEEDDSGLKLIHHIRDDLGNKFSRIVLRTGQPGQAPPKDIIRDYDINDYKEKTELTDVKLYTTVMAALRDYNDILTIEEDRRIIDRNRRGLEKIIHSTARIFETRSMKEFAEGTLTQIQSLLKLRDDAVYFKVDGFTAISADSDFQILAGTGKYQDLKEQNLAKALSPEVYNDINNAIEKNISCHMGDAYLGIFKASNNSTYILYTQGSSPLNADEQNLINIFASNVSIAFDNIVLQEDILNTQTEIVSTLGDIIETRYSATAHHVERVAELSYYLGKKANIPEADLIILKFASTLHDVGKIGISDSVLLKPGALSPNEFDKVKEHAQIGYRILEKSDRKIFKAAATVCHQHHECWDGSGYPFGIKGEEISLFSRIVSIVDVFDALTHDRVYKDAYSFELAKEMMEAEREKAFDPELLDLFFKTPGDIKKILTSFP